MEKGARKGKNTRKRGRAKKKWQVAGVNSIGGPRATIRGQKTNGATHHSKLCKETAERVQNWMGSPWERKRERLMYGKSPKGRDGVVAKEKEGSKRKGKAKRWEKTISKGVKERFKRGVTKETTVEATSRGTEKTNNTGYCGGKTNLRQGEGGAQ